MRAAVAPDVEPVARTPEAQAAFEARRQHRRDVVLEHIGAWEVADAARVRAHAVQAAPVPRSATHSAATFTVNSAYDDSDASPGNGTCATGHILPNGTFECTLRAALQEAIALGGNTTIRLDLRSPGRGGFSFGYDAANDVWTLPINTAAGGAEGPLPQITAPNITIDGTTQLAGSAGFAKASCGNLIGGTPHTLKVVVDGSLATGISDAFTTTSTAIGFSARGLVVSNWPGTAFFLEGANATFTCSYIGTDVTGTLNHGNGQYAFYNRADGIAVGGTGAGDGNVLSGNTVAIRIAERSPEDNMVQGNLIGTNATGTAAIPNGGGITVIGSDNLVGGATPSARNILSGHTGWALVVSGQYDTIEGNYIGTDRTGTAAIPNTNDTFRLLGFNNDIIGNVISGNTGSGMDVWFRADYNRIEGNYIGVNAAGTAALGNGKHGIHLYDEAYETTIGGPDPADRNVISGNGGSGVRIEGSSAYFNTVRGNYIGLNAAGTTALPNSNQGNVYLLNGAHDNLIADNVMAGDMGVRIAGGSTTNNRVTGNLIGTDATGANGLSNGNWGVSIEGAPDNTIGGTTAADRNVIAEYSFGVLISGASATGNLVQGNYIGTDVTGTHDLGHFNGAVLLMADASGNTIGGTTGTTPSGPCTGVCNVIAGSPVGVGIMGSGSSNNIVAGNFIGTDATGGTAIPNTNGVSLVGGLTNTVGGTEAGAGNVISGNTEAGILINAPASSNLVQGNLIGTKAAGTAALPNGQWGIDILESGKNIIGGTSAGARNVVSGNFAAGISIIGEGATGNQVLGNFIGTDLAGNLPIPNSVGVSILASDNIIGGVSPGEGNLIAFNASNGVDVRPLPEGAVGNTIRGNRTYANGGLGIDLCPVIPCDGTTANDVADNDKDSGPNKLQNFPALLSAVYDEDNLAVMVEYVVPTDPAYAVYPLVIDFYVADADLQEGRAWIGSDTYTASDFSDGPTKTVTFTPAAQISSADHLLATATDQEGTGSTSEFMGTGAGANLPVELVSFEAQRDGPVVLLRWATASETNNAGFEIQSMSTDAEADDRSLDQWHVVRFVEGHGTSREAQRYTYRVDGLTPGTHRFRLKQIDFDGTFAYSPEVEVVVELMDEYVLSSVWPNPFNPEAAFTLAVREPQQVAVVLYDMLGREVARLHDGLLPASETHRFAIDGRRLATGQYLIHIVGEHFRETRPVTLVK